MTHAVGYSLEPNLQESVLCCSCAQWTGEGWTPVVLIIWLWKRSVRSTVYTVVPYELYDWGKVRELMEVYNLLELYTNFLYWVTSRVRL